MLSIRPKLRPGATEDTTLISLGLAELKNLHAAPATSVPVHLSSHCALRSYEIFAQLALRLSVPLRPLVQIIKCCPTSGALWSSAMSLFVGRDRIGTTTNQVMKDCLSAKETAEMGTTSNDGPYRHDRKNWIPVFYIFVHVAVNRINLHFWIL